MIGDTIPDTVAATVAGAPVLVAEVDAREALLRDGPAAALPAPGTSEGRQLRRWLTQLIVTERVITTEAEALGVTAGEAPAEENLLPDATARLELGSVAAAAPPLEQVRPVIAEHLRAAARRRAFRVWLDARRAEQVRLAPGYEHPGDPRQPDNTHRH